MTKKRLSSTILELISIDRNPRSELAAGELTAGEIASLKEIVTRRLAPSGPFRMAKAITALARSEKSRDVCRILGKFVVNDSEAATDRAIAAINLRLIPGQEAQKALVASLSVADPRVRQQVIKSLGTFGDDDALGEFEKLLDPDQESVRKQLSFAKALIAHRAGRSAKYLPYRQGISRKPGSDDKLIKLSLRPLREQAFRSERESLLGSTYGIEIGDKGFALRAGKARWTVFVNRELGEEAGFGGLFERTWIAALLARWDLRTKTATVQYVVLTDSQKSSTDIMVVRTDGEVFYTGRANRTGGLLKFSMQDVERSGTAPTNVQGRLSSKGVELEVCIPFGQRKDQSSGEPAVAERHG